MAQIIKPEVNHLLNSLSMFPIERLTRCGATPAQIVAEQANWATHTQDWQAQEAHYLRSQPDSAIQAAIAAWPPAVPAAFSSAWPYQ